MVTGIFILYEEKERNFESMVMVQMQCGSCRGVFSVSKGFFNGESNPVFCTFCGEKQLINGGEFEYNRGVLDDQQRNILRHICKLRLRTVKKKRRLV